MITGTVHNSILSSFWIVSGLWLFFTAVDYAMTFMELKLYRKLAKGHIKLFDGSELNPFVGISISSSYKPIRLLLLPCAGYALLWASWTGVSVGAYKSGAWEFAAGMALLFYVPAFVRHMRWLVFFGLLFSDGEKNWFHGLIECSPSFFLRQYAVDMIGTALVCIILFAATTEPFFGGGGLSLVLSALTCLKL